MNLSKFHKPLLAAVLSVLSCIGASAADLPESSKKYIGVRAAFEMTTSTKMSQICGYRPGASAGAVYHGTFGSRFFFEAGPQLFFSSVSVNSAGVEDSPLVGNISGHMNDIGIRLPVDFGYQLPVSGKVVLLAYTGPVLSFNFKTDGKFAWSGTNASTAEKMSKLHNTGMDIGWNVGIGADIAGHWRVAAECLAGFSDLCSMEYFKTLNGKNEAYFRRLTFGVSLGYNF